MGRIKIFLVLLCLSIVFSSQGQKLGVPDDPAIFGDSVKTILNNTRNQTAIETGDSFAIVWTGLGADQQQKIVEQTKSLIEKGLKVRPILVAYFQAINSAVEIEGADTQKITDYLNMTGKVIEYYGDQYDQNYLINYFKTINTFFTHHALYSAKSNKLNVLEDTYYFEFVETALPMDEEPKVEETTEDEYYEDDGDYDDDYTDEETTDDEWFDDWDSEEPSDDDWDTEWDDDGSSDDDLITAITGGIILPEIKGPAIRFESLTLNFATPYDSVFLSGTSGDFLIGEQLFVGKSGKFDWSMAGLSADSVYATFETYSFDVRKAQLKAESTKLTYIGKVDDPVDGVFEYRNVRHDSTNDATYPRFESYQANIQVKDLGEDLIYRGGFSLNGSKIYSSSLLGNLSSIEVQGDISSRFKARAKIFEFADSTITTKRASVVIYQGNDSIYHPAVRLKYDYKNQYLVLQKEKGGFKNTPYTSTFFDVDFTADIIKWDLNSDSLDISILEARRIVPAIIESADHYSIEDYRALGDKIYTFNPLSMVVYYSNDRRMDQFYVSDLAKKFKKDERVLRGAMVFLSQKGLIGFDAQNDLITVKEKARHLFDSKLGKKDFDNIILASVTHTEPNATLNFDQRYLKVRGVEYFKVSDSLNVMITPDSSEITILQNRDFSFDGKIRAGNFEYIGRNFTFKYDSFLIYLNEIDSIQFYVQEENSRGSFGNKKVDNALVSIDSVGSDDVANNLQASSGTLFINKPTNKSGKSKEPNYPKFDSKKGAVVYFDRKEVLSGAYDRSMYFIVPPFNLDSLGDSNPRAIGFEGTFISSGMLPVFKEKLEIMSDYSLGFNHTIPVEGYQLYQGEGRLFNKIRMNKDGLRGDGRIEFLTTTLESNDFVFYPDSVSATGTSVEIKEENYNGVIYPQATIENYRMKWLPKKDSMYLYNQEEPMKFYNETASLDGEAIVTKKGVYGAGKLLTRGSVSESKKMTFEHDRFSARNAQFELQSNNPDKPALYGDNVRLRFNLAENYADISPEVEGNAAIEFPFAQFKTSITQARWDLDEEKITMIKPEDVPIESSYFYTTREELDSLSFNATRAVYDINTLELKVSGIPYIVVADAKITPENNEVLILENSKIGQLINTTIVLDTLNEYHRLTEGVIEIKSRNEFSGYATYQFVNSLNDTVPIKMENFHLEEIQVGTTRKGTITEKHTVANGSVSETQNIIISPGMFYKGDMILYAHKPAMQLDGFVKLDLNEPGYNTWIEHRSSGDQKDVVINFDNAITEEGRKLEAGLHFSAGDNSLYHTFITQRFTPDDEDFFKPSGVLFFEKDKNEYVIEDSLKAEGKSLAGQIFRFNQNTGDLVFEGKAQFMRSTDDVKVNASVIGIGNINRVEYNLNTMLALDFGPVPVQAYDMMALDLLDVVNNLGAPEGLGDPTQLLYKLADLSGERVAREYERQTLQEYVSLGGFSKETTVPLVFADINMKWSVDHNAFYSEGKLGMSNINRHDLNAAFDGFLEMKRNEDGTPVFNLFIKASGASWFYFSYEDNRLLIFSSNNNFNKLISKKSNGAKAKIGELIFAPASRAEVLNFINRYRLEYYGIDDIYKLDSETEEVEATENEGIGTTEEEDDGFEEDDDGF